MIGGVSILLFIALEFALGEGKENPIPATFPHVASATQKMPHSPEEDTAAEHNAVASRYDRHVHFWGKVVDQDNVPLEGVNITVTVTTLRLIKTANGYREYEVLKTNSGADGTFMFDGAEGMYLDIEAIEKEGYVLPSACQFGISHVIGAKYHYPYSSIGSQEKVFSPSHARPEVFHLWKLINPEPLVIGGNYPGRSGPEFMVGGQPTLFRTIRRRKLITFTLSVI